MDPVSEAATTLQSVRDQYSNDDLVQSSFMIMACKIPGKYYTAYSPRYVSINFMAARSYECEGFPTGKKESLDWKLYGLYL